jgi:hypothetical protein
MFNAVVLTESKTARVGVLKEIPTDSLKGLFLGLFPDAQLVGDEITRTELERVYEISKQTATRFIRANADELEGYGYRVVGGTDSLKALVEGMDIDAHTFFGRTTVVGLFTIPAALAFGMMLETPTGEKIRAAAIHALATQSLAQQKATVGWANARAAGKAVRRDFADVLKDVYDAAGSSQPFSRWATNFTEMMTTKVLGISRAEFRARKAETGNFRDSATVDELEALEAAERVVVARFRRHGADSIRALYHDAKSAMDVFAA